jgi:hypothetical protein
MSADVQNAKGDPKVKVYEIVVNGTPATVADETVTFEQVVMIAFPGPIDANVIYSVAYRNARGGRGGSGTLVAGGSVKVKEKGTSFNVTATTRS